MDPFTRQEFDALARHSRPWCVSLYFPTDRTANGMLQTPIRLRNLTTQAEEMLVEHGLRAPEAHRLLRPLRELPGRAAFLKAVSEGAAIFVDDLGMRAYRLPCRFEERVVVGNRFHIKPLLPIVAGEGRFLVLATSANSMRMYAGDRWHVEEVEVPGLPKNLREALGHDAQQTVRQVHTAGSAAGGHMQPGYHGQGGRADVAKDDLLEFFHLVDRALKKFLAEDQRPLVFAGVQYLFPIFKKACSYPFLAEDAVVGNTDDWSSTQLHAAAWPVVEQMIRRQMEEAVARSHRVAGTDYGLLQLERVLQACRIGQVDTLLVDAQQSRWGVFDPELGTVRLDDEPRPGNEDLLDLAIVESLANSGTVFPADASDLPDRTVVAAILRYPTTATPIPRPAELSTSER